MLCSFENKRQIQGPVDEVTFVGCAKVFGELIMSKRDDAGVRFDNYFAINYFTLGDEPRGLDEEIWFVREH